MVVKPGKSIANFTSSVIFLSCSLFTIWQSFRCFQKFFANPQATFISIERPSHHIFPALTICPNQFLTSSQHQAILQQCGIANNEYQNFGKWSGNCSDPKELYYQIMIPLEDVVMDVTYSFLTGPPSNFNQTSLSTLEWSLAGSYLYGRCYQLNHSEGIARRSISAISLSFLVGVDVYVHSPGNWQSSMELNSFKIDSSGAWYWNKISHNVFHMLSHVGEPCVLDNGYDFDECNARQLDKESLNEIGCTSPFGYQQDNICTNATLGAKAHALYLNSLKEPSPQCKHPCNYVTTSVIEGGGYQMGDRTRSIAEFLFRDKITVTKSLFSYSGLSLIAEIGGYVGLFLGVSINQISAVINFVIAKAFAKHQ